MVWSFEERDYFKGKPVERQGRKPEGTKVRKLDHVSRLPLFPYHHNIWKRCLNRRDSDTFYIYRCVILKKYSRDTGRFWQVPFCMQKWVTKLAGTGFLYTDKSRMKKA